MNLADMLKQQLSANGIHQLYTIPGDFILPWLNALEASGLTEPSQDLQLIQLSHEPSAVYAADAAARWRNAPSAVMLTYGAGALNAINALAQAHMEYVPLLVFAGYPSKQEIASGLLLHHQVNDLDAQRRMLAEVTCGQCRLDDATTAPLQLAKMIQLATEQSRPVLIELPRDMAKAAVPGDLVVTSATSAQQVVASQHCAKTRQQLALYAQQLAQTVAQPLLLVGVKAKRFGFDQAVAALARCCQMPALTTLLGRGVLDVSAPYYKGVYSGAKEDPVLPWLQQSDLLICCGVMRTDSNFAAHPQLISDRAVLWIDQEQSTLPNGTVVDLPANVVLEALSEAFAAHKQPERLVVPLVDTAQQEQPVHAPWRSDLLVTRLHQLLSQQQQNYPFVVDIGDCLFAALSANPTMLLAPAFYASMGFAVPASLGLQLSSGLRPIVLVGDGAFQMTGLELGHCQRYGLNPIVIVLNNQSWGMIKAFAPDLSAAALGGWQYAALGRAMGCGASQIWNLSQLDGALADALADTRRPRLIEVMLPQHSYSERLASFQRGLCQSA